MQRIKFCLWALVAFCLLLMQPVLALADNSGSLGVFKVGLIEGGREPYYWQNPETKVPEGFYVDVMNAISKETGVHVEYFFIPQARIRLYMRLGLLNFEPGVAKSWRQEPEEVELSVYSDPLLVLREVIVSRVPFINQPKSLQDLEAGKVCQVLGFNGKNNTGHEEVIVINDLQALRMLKRGRCDYAVMPFDVAHYLSQKHDIQLFYSEHLDQHVLALRLDKQFEGLLPDINRVLSNLRASGEMAALLEHYQIESLKTDAL